MLACPKQLMGRETQHKSHLFNVCRFLNYFFDGLEYEPIEAFCKVCST